MPYKKIFASYIIIILLLVVLPLNGTNSVLSNTFILEFRLDYILHSLLFLPFIFLFRQSCRYSFLKAFLLGLLFAVLTEGLQFLLPYRAFNINDLVANVLGICMGSVFWKKFHRDRTYDSSAKAE